MLCCARSQHAQPMSALCNGKGAVVGGDCASITKICRWWHLSACQKSFSNLENAIGRGFFVGFFFFFFCFVVVLCVCFVWFWFLCVFCGLFFCGFFFVCVWVC